MIQINKIKKGPFTQLPVFSKDYYGHVMTLNEFIEECERGSFIDYDGHAREIIMERHIIYSEAFYPSDVLEQKEELLKLQEELGTLKIAWYNK